MKNRILFVDDNPNVLTGLERMLHGCRAEWDMWFIQHAEEAMHRMQETPFDAVVLDINMPRLDGFGLLLAARQSERTKDVPIVILTGLNDHNIKRRALDLGATDLLSKPVAQEDLIARIRSVLRLKSNQDQLKSVNSLLDQEVRERTCELERSQQEIIWRLGKAAEYRDEETGNHVMRVGAYSRLLAEQLGLPSDFVQRLFLTSPLHDVGKIGVPDKILLKPGKLTPEEWKIMERHCVIGAAILMQYPRGMQPFLAWNKINAVSESSPTENGLLKMAASIALTHHERWDGQGYPMGMPGKDIPLESRIVALADTYDAISLARPYAPALPREKVIQTIREEDGSHFDPNVCAAFEQALDEFRTIHALFADEAALLARQR